MKPHHLPKTNTYLPSFPPLLSLLLPLQGSCTDGEAKVTMLVVSSAFIPLKRLDRHKLVNSAMKSYLDDGGEIHALTLKLQTPEQYNK